MISLLVVAALPRDVPALVRLRRRRGRVPRRDRVGRSSCPRSSRCSARGWRRCASSRCKPPSEDGFWGRQAARVMKHPIPYAVGVSAVLVVLAIPFLNFNPGLIDDRVVPDHISSRAATDQIRENFTSREADALQVLLPDARASSATPTRSRRSPRSSRRCPVSRGSMRATATTCHEGRDRSSRRRTSSAPGSSPTPAKQGPGCRSCPTSSRTPPRVSGWSRTFGPTAAPFTFTRDGRVGDARRHQGVGALAVCRGRSVSSRWPRSCCCS